MTRFSIIDADDQPKQRTLIDQSGDDGHDTTGNHAVCTPRKHLVADGAPPGPKRDLIQRDSADRHGHRLRAGVPTHPGHDRHVDRQQRQRRNRFFE
jgi:hypothetical protein